ncbi:MAG: hypothetical protein VW268_13335 [Rhodospirillaceae bacterium]
MATITKPSRVDRAFERLDRALSRLEQAAKNRPAQSLDDGRMSDLQAENTRLQKVNREVGGRLDDAIGRLEKALDGRA